MSALVPLALSIVLVAWLLDLDTYVSEALGDWWRRLTFTGRHSRRWMRQQAAEVRRRRVREERAHEAALDVVWTTGIAEWAARARGDGLDRGRVAWT